MNPVLTQCPVCEGDLTITRLYCRHCDTSIEGRFVSGPFAGLTLAQLDFVETFVRCEGKFTRMEGELGLSYPTIRGRLHDIIRALGYEPGGEEPEGISEQERQAVLAQLEEGRISTEQALGILRGAKGIEAGEEEE